MRVANNKTAISRAYTAARAYINTHAGKYGADETVIRLNALRIVRNQLIELLDDSGAESVSAFTDLSAFKQWFLNGARDTYQLVSSGGSIFPFVTTDVLRLFYAPSQRAKWQKWADGKGTADYALSDVMHTEAKWIEVALGHMWAALKNTCTK